MVKNYIYILVTSVMVFIAAGGEVCGQGLDSLRKIELTERLGEYFEALKYESIEVQKAECDFLIETANSQEVRDFIAQTIYDHYIASKIMGAEAVAVHLTDTWFIPKKVSFRDESELFAARIFAEFNRQSLVGNKAPELEMETIDGEKRNLFGEAGNGRFKLLFFYDTDCVNCRLESIMLRNILETEDFPVDLYAVYVGDNRDSWSAYVAERLTLEDGMASVVHLGTHRSILIFNVNTVSYKPRVFSLFRRTVRFLAEDSILKQLSKCFTPYSMRLNLITAGKNLLHSSRGFCLLLLQ